MIGDSILGTVKAVSIVQRNDKSEANAISDYTLKLKLHLEKFCLKVEQISLQ